MCLLCCYIEVRLAHFYSLSFIDYAYTVQVMIRDYTDMLWSSYNFWCKREYDGPDCDYSKWANPELHTRSPEVFHELVQADANYTQGKSYSIMELLYWLYVPHSCV